LDEHVAEYVKVYKKLGGWIKDFDAVMDDVEDEDELKDIIDLVHVFFSFSSSVPHTQLQLKEHDRSARTADLRKVKEVALKIIIENPETTTLQLPIPQSKTGQGFNHPDTARMLLPRRYIADFDADAVR
jgi:hypothetical protein